MKRRRNGRKKGGAIGPAFFCEVWLFEEASQGEIVEAPSHVNQRIDGHLAVGATVARVESVTGIEFAEGFQCGIFVMEHFDEHVSELAGFCGSGEEISNPSVVRAEAAARGFGGGMEDSEFIVGSQLGDEVGIFDD